MSQVFYQLGLVRRKLRVIFELYAAIPSCVTYW
uniref:Uncharacterized protein n=1 Tax=Siphoviridae sp. ctAUQ2 TaxID=2826182 RepID=A0A8S5MZB8_9CAUD|nr:MAG TPA: hypothetical protein [Siphoviridae sp. ctAUQ2]